MLKKSLIFIAVIALVFSACRVSYAGGDHELVGQAFVEITAENWLNSTPLKIASLKGKVVVADFWTTWCPPCKKSIPHLIELGQKLKDDIVVVGITDEGKDVAEPFAKEMKMNYAIATGSKSVGDYKVTRIPTTFVISRGGRIAWAGLPSEGLDKAIDTEIKKTAEEPASAQKAAAPKKEGNIVRGSTSLTEAEINAKPAAEPAPPAEVQNAAPAAEPAPAAPAST